ncbi:MAG: hypothetical protein J0M15_16435 [Deltaproteobacteria bacterium]|nr:hypothetical protein [Deltaproteobacteria bacterium]
MHFSYLLLLIFILVVDTKLAIAQGKVCISNSSSHYVTLELEIKFKVDICLKNGNLNIYDFQDIKTELNTNDLIVFQELLRDLIKKFPKFMSQIYQNGFDKFEFYKSAKDSKYLCKKNPGYGIVYFSGANGEGFDKFNSCIRTRGKAPGRFVLSYDLIHAPTSLQDQYTQTNWIRRILLHELAHGFDNDTQSFSNSKKFLELIKWDYECDALVNDNCSKLMDHQTAKQLQRETIELLNKSEVATAYNFLREGLKKNGIPSLYSILKTPDEMFAEYAAYIYSDPEASQYIPNAIISWYREFVLR